MDGRVFTAAVENAERVFSIATVLGLSLTVLDVGGGFFGNKTPPVSFKEVLFRNLIGNKD